MISKEFIESFEKILSYYKIEQSDVFDIVRAISFSESSGTHQIRLNDLAVSGVPYFSNIVTNKTDAKSLPDTRLARVMVDSLVVILYTMDNRIFSRKGMINILTKLSYPVQKVRQASVNFYHNDSSRILRLEKVEYYKTLEECESDMKLLVSTCVEANTQDITGLHKLAEFIERNCTTKFDFKGLKLPEEYRGSLDDIYFCTNASYIRTNLSLLDCVTNCLLEYIIGDTDKLKLSLLITTKARYINLNKKLLLKLHADKYALIRQDSFIINALNTAYTFTHADSLQNIESIELLYALLFASSTEAKQLGKTGMFGGN